MKTLLCPGTSCKMNKACRKYSENNKSIKDKKVCIYNLCQEGKFEKFEAEEFVGN